MDISQSATDCYQTACPRCKSVIKLSRGHDGEGGVSYCCEHAFYWNRVWAVTVTDDNRRSFEEVQATHSPTSKGSD